MTMGKADHLSVALQMSKQFFDAYKLRHRLVSCTMLGASRCGSLGVGIVLEDSGPGISLSVLALRRIPWKCLA
eukprot:CAMPEP_0177471814 /NCGR_PEP_ID=MMETSP0369-20130122/20961_1 /TAXON_ID=447022 ORGANISM="Scrippsiella hangoei-like, Strain SHHI-4" /NCGR_SAMPLE_ID=MMETSP0369 /ASSEMBLY_ACC=CAM_ASM_000364 /LENGTH=72 /DNA_ID=CAMNT_0018946417 /DNA_START=150 /DNA_END=365 /DNA_ORIENTATION=-